MVEACLVVGGGIAGIQAALDLADQGIKVFLVEKTPTIGGRMAQLDKTFPTLDCSMCILTPKMAEVKENPNITLMTCAEVVDVQGFAGNFKIKVRKTPRYVDEEKCTGCGDCSRVCPVEVPNEFDMSLGTRKAIYIPFPQAVPSSYLVDEASCVGIAPLTCGKCLDVCSPDAINLNRSLEEFQLDVGAIIIATGFNPDDPRKKEKYGYGVYSNVMTSLELERLLSASGPTGGEVRRCSDKKAPKRIAFIQCVCSRDVTTNFYCSRFCCMYAIKEGILVKEHTPDTECTVFYMDIRAFGKGFQEFFHRAKDEYGIRFIRSRPSKIEEDPETKNLFVVYEDTTTGVFRRMEVDLVVLAVGVLPSLTEMVIPIPIGDDKFINLKSPNLDPVSSGVEGIFIAGVSEGPKDIPDSVTQASAAAMRASILIKGGRR